jgi:hypothetical protein
MAFYFIESGVHRAIAARENGLDTIEAWLHTEGQPPTEIEASLDDLHSPRASVSRVVTKRRNLPGLIVAMATPATRVKIPRIHLQILGTFGQPRSVPLMTVTITNELSEEWA